MNEWSYNVDKVHTQSKMNISSEVNKNVVNISRACEREEDSNMLLEQRYPDLFKAVGERGGIPVLVPLHSVWFSMEAIHPIERRVFSAFLSGHEGVQKYVSARNTIFKMYQENTSTHVSITLCRRRIPEDISTLIKIYTFLEHWGLINYKIGVRRDMGKLIEKIQQKDLFDITRGSAVVETVPSQGVPPENAAASEGVLEGLGAGEAREKSEEKPDPGACIDVSEMCEGKRYVTVGESSIPAPGGSASMQKPSIDMLRDPSKHFSLQSTGFAQNSIPAEAACTSCGRVMQVLSMEEKVYFSERGRIMLCSGCFNGGEYPASCTYANFHVLEAGMVRQIWSEKEEMLLLEGIEMYKDDWKAVADYVKTKTLEQCVLQFLKMGIQDPFLEMEAISFSENKMPFNYTLNPVMSTVAFLASVIHPGVASAAAKAAVAEIQRNAAENEGKDDWLNGRLNEIAAVALSACMGRAQSQKVLEEGKKERLLELLVESEMKRIDLKVTEFTDLARTLKKEREDLEKMRETYRKAHLEARKEIAEVVSKLRKICSETGRSFEEVFFNE
ncbi:SWI/SNF related-matrix-associated actin-dependent regulator of chromatin subfamily C [Nematocida major]|uniref:SWI/SNF related-matrix-associated actin-dependent regulator of chromatin subfamily C n=1 Tax=Nematocida major TaxID=1912982 RepID=UPI00200827CC|nr:SWI/SNF related-matrix-associated actin-dependent regulator of chromatin subfamily C [Nematocida major]KAH9386566.1 SWI/SNF related-matrix-associated actin-dependent regulator of chromatin subfamily C [Nematocida major]